MQQPGHALDVVQDSLHSRPLQISALCSTSAAVASGSSLRPLPACGQAEAQMLPHTLPPHTLTR